MHAGLKRGKEDTCKYMENRSTEEQTQKKQIESSSSSHSVKWIHHIAGRLFTWH